MTKKEKEFTAKEMHHAPGPVWKAASKDGAIVFHKHFSNKVFEIKAIDIDVYYEGVKVDKDKC